MLLARHRQLVIQRLYRTFLSVAAALAGGLAIDPQPIGAQIPTRQQIDQIQNVRLSDDPAAILAYVGRTPILMGDLMPKVEARIQQVLEKSDQAVPEDQLHFARINLLRGLLAQSIQQKMMRESFLIEQVGTAAADKRREANEQLTARARRMFSQMKLPELQKQYSVDDLNELDTKLRAKGTSLAAQRRDFVDAILGHLYLREKVDRDPKVSIAEIAEYYHSNETEFHRPTRARWEQLTVLKSNYATREEAQAALEEMGREAYYGGNLQAVARAKSEEPFADQGGLHDWTAKDSLASEPLNQEIFSIPLNEMSEIIEDDTALHIVRVLERTEAGKISLKEVQDDIRTKIRKEKIAKSQAALMREMQKRIPVWSLFPDDVPGAKPLPENLASRHQATDVR